MITARVQPQGPPTSRTYHFNQRAHHWENPEALAPLVSCLPRWWLFQLSDSSAIKASVTPLAPRVSGGLLSIEIHPDSPPRSQSERLIPVGFSLGLGGGGVGLGTAPAASPKSRGLRAMVTSMITCPSSTSYHPLALKTQVPSYPQLKRHCTKYHMWRPWCCTRRHNTVVQHFIFSLTTLIMNGTAMTFRTWSSA